MIKGKLKKELKIDTILEKLSPFDIFYYYIPDKNWSINQVMSSPLREDKSPSFLVGNKYGELSFFDFANDQHRGDVFKFVKIMFNLPNLNEVLKKIDSDFQLGLSDGVEENYQSEVLHKEPNVEKRNTLIQVVTKKFTKTELDYWSSYGITLEELQRENIYSIKKAYLNKKLLNLDELRFAYYFDGLFKVYQPNSDKKRKWLSNVPLTYIDGLDQNFDFTKPIIIQKSKKDKMVTKKLCPDWNVVNTQNESVSSITKENHELFDKFCGKYIFWDNDLTGIEQCKKLNIKGYGWLNIPSRFKSKDISELVIEIGIKEAKNVLKEIANKKNIC